MIPITFQPIIENSFEHGGRASHEPMDITLSAKVTDGTLLLDFRDNGAGMTEEKRQALNLEFEQIAAGALQPVGGSEHIALRNIAERLYLRYGGVAGLRIPESDSEGTTVRITMPYTEENA